MLTRNGYFFHLWKNGIKYTGTIKNIGNHTLYAGTTNYIGTGSTSDSNSLFSGIISNFRMVFGKSFYKDNQLISSNPPIKTSNTSLLLTGNQLRIKDLSMNYTMPNSTISTNKTPYRGGSSLEFNNSYYTIDNSTNFLGSWTLEFWINFNSLVNGIFLYCPGGWGLGIYSSYVYTYRAVTSPSSGILAAGALSISYLTTNKWYHIALTRDGNTTTSNLKTWLNGNFIQTTNDIGLYVTGNFLTIGYIAIMNITDLRITQGIRYSTSFNPPNGLSKN